MKTLIPLILLLLAFSVNAQFTNPSFVHSEFHYPVFDVAVADLDGDGFNDFVFAHDIGLSWSKNLEDKNKWSTNFPIDHTYFNISRKIATVDLDEDGWIDIVSIRATQEDTIILQWYRNEGFGQFNEPIFIETFQVNSNVDIPPMTIIVEDLDMDGHQDILVAANSNLANTDNVIWYKNDGQGNISERIVLDESSNVAPTSMNIGDANSDGYLDIIVVNSETQFLIYENNMGQGFLEPQFINTTLFHEYISVGLSDIDGDGLVDIYAGTDGGQDIRWIAQTSPGVFSADENRIDIDFTTFSLNQIFNIDIDNDGDLDFVFASYFNKMGYIENLDGLGNYDSPVFLWEGTLTSYANSILRIEDWDNDGDPDIIYSGYETKENLLFENSDGQGNFVQNQSFTMSPGGYFHEQHFGDLDGDGHMDVMVADDELSWMRYNPEFEAFERPRFIELPFEPQDMTIIDINVDGIPDVVYTNDEDDGLLHYKLNDGNGTFGTAQSIPFIANFYLTLYAEDLDNDGDQDLIVSSGNPGGDGIFWYKNLGTSTGSFAAAEFLETNAVNRITFVDVDNDGVTDLIPDFNNSSDLGWIKNNGGSFEPWTEFVENSFSFNRVIFDDVNSDGLKDILLNRSGSFAYYEQIGDLAFEEIVYIPNAGNSTYNFHFIDYDLDGYKDLFFSKETEGFYWKRNTNDVDLFDEAIFIDLGLQEYQRFHFQDLDGDSDEDLIYKDFYNTYTLTNISANGQINANAFYDENNNGLFETNEPTLNHFGFKLDPDETIHFTANDQEKRFFVNEGDYVLNSLPMQGWNLTTGENNCAITFVEDSIINKHFGYFPETINPSITASLSAAATRCGFTVPFWLTYENDGTTIENGWIELEIIDNATLLSAEPAPDSTNNNKILWSFDNLAPTQQKKVNLFFEVEGVSALGDSVRMNVNSYSVSDEVWTVLESKPFASEINCAYDPNDKLVEPAGLLDNHYTLVEDTLYYTIRFQNTGTDTAFNIRITDEIDPNLDLSTFQTTASSHFMETSMDESRRSIEFYFPNILMPDSTVNEPLSHGFVQFKIKPKQNLEDGIRVENEANIFFDFNPPILTNRTWNTLLNSFEISSTAEIESLLCNGDSNGRIELTTSIIPPFTYEWSGLNSTESVIENLEAGEYLVTVTDGIGQSASYSYFLDQPEPLAAALSSTPQIGTVLGTATVEVSGGTPDYTITWNTVPIQSGPTANNLPADMYTVNIEDDNGCMFEGMIEVPLSTSTQELLDQSTINIFPNPTKDELTINFGKTISNTSQLSIFNTNGQTVYTALINKATSSLTLSSKELSIKAGVYWLQLDWDQQSIVQKIVVLP